MGVYLMLEIALWLLAGCTLFAAIDISIARYRDRGKLRDLNDR